MINYLRKRDNRIVQFNQDKITQAVHKALMSVRGADNGLSETISSFILTELLKKYDNMTPGVEDVQDVIEETLIANKFDDVARAYILYRARRTKTRELRDSLGVSDDLKLNINAVRVMEKRYLLKDDKGHVIETPRECFERVARVISKVDEHYGADSKKSFEEFYYLMSNLLFLPNSPTIMNAGGRLGQLSACFAIPINDSLESIFDAVKHTALIHQSGGGIGFNFSNLRPNGDSVNSTGGIASGPVSFMKIFDMTTEVIKQGGRRRGANMGVLNVNHQDIIEFINSKLKSDSLNNFNLSVALTDDFMKALSKGRDYWLINPRTGERVNKVNSREVFELIVNNAWMTGDPGILFIDEINRHNPTPSLGRIECTNPCGELPLLPYESCNLGSINLSRMVKGNSINWELLRRTVHSGVHFLDNVIDANKHPLQEIKEITLGNRKIGLGVMGFSDMLIKLNIPYNSTKALRTAGKLMKFIRSEAIAASVNLAKLRGSFPNFKVSVWSRKGCKMIRNASILTIAPTGSISIIAGCSSGIEPLFAVSFVRKVLEGTSLFEVNESFELEALRGGFYSDDLIHDIALTGSLKNLKNIPLRLQRLFATAFDIKPEWHVKMQAVFQKYVDNSVSKTINFPTEARVKEVRKAYLMAYKLKCKGITVYRYASRAKQVLYFNKDKPHVTAECEYSGGCPEQRCLH